MKLKLLPFALLVSALALAQTPTKLSSGQFGFNEGPVWDRSDKIYFSDVGTRKVETYTISNNTFSTAFTSTVRTNGLMFDENSNLVICEFQGGNITQKSITGTLLDTYGTGFTNPNDLCIDKKGGIYVSSPGDFNNQSSHTNQIYYISPEPTRTTTLVDSSIAFPNGVIISNNGETLYVTDTIGYIIYKFDIDLSTGLLSNRQTFATLTDTDNTDTFSRADGMALDTDGNLYVANKKSIQVFNTSGTLINTISFTETPTNCTFGGASLNTLYVTTPKDLYSIQFTGVTGFQHPFDLPESNLSADSNIFNANTIKVHPNPITNNEVNITTQNINIKNVALFNPTGQKLKDYSVISHNKTLKIVLSTSISKGVYFLSLTNSNNTTVIKKVIIE